MKIEIVIDEKSFDEQIGNVIKAKVKQVLRNSKYLNALIEEIINTEVQKRASILALTLDKEELLQAALKKLPSSDSIARKVLSEVEKQVRTMLASDIGKENVKRIKTLIKS